MTQQLAIEVKDLGKRFKEEMDRAMGQIGIRYSKNHASGYVNLAASFVRSQKNLVADRGLREGLQSQATEPRTLRARVVGEVRHFAICYG